MRQDSPLNPVRQWNARREIDLGTLDDLDRNSRIRLLKRVFPVGTVSRCVRATGRAQRTVQRWLSGELRIPDEDQWALEHSVEAMETVNFNARLTKLIEEALAEGAYKESVGAHLAQAHEALLSRELD